MPISVRAFRMGGTGKRVKNPRCRATVSESLAQGHCANGKAPPLSAMPIATRKPGDRRELVTNPFRVQRRSVMFIVRALLAALLCCTAALAADLKVSVQSPSGDRVSGVQVSLFRAGDNCGVGVQTTAGDGTATFPNLPDGQYRAVVLAPGFAEQSLQVAIPGTEALTVQLKLTTTPQTVVVSATATPTTAEQTGTSVGLLTSEQLTAINPVSRPRCIALHPRSDRQHYRAPRQSEQLVRSRRRIQLQQSSGGRRAGQRSRRLLRFRRCPDEQHRPARGGARYRRARCTDRMP